MSKLHKLRVLGLKVKLKAALLSSDPAMAQQSATAISPLSSKRSRSRDSTLSATHPSSSSSSLPSTPAAHTPSISAINLVSSASASALATPSNGEYASDGTPYPAFLDPDRADVHAKWTRLEWAHTDRLRDSASAYAPGADSASPWARCSGDDYAMRNRYANVDPYQANRVRLEIPDGYSDYINASPIILETSASHTALRYIATQGPKADSWSHLWRMVWHQNSSPCVIVMLTQTIEMGREKCHPYYPQAMTSPQLRTNEHDEFNDGLIHTLNLASLTQHKEARTQVREIDMTADGDDDSETKKIWHLLFSAWPDFSVPEGADRVAMLKLIDMSRQKNSDNTNNPRIVHCSAGIGRSGTFIALDWLLQELEEGSLDSLPDHQDPIITVVESLRDQRAGMVQSKSQFLFLYDVLRERWRERWISLHPDEAAALGLASAVSSESDQPALKRHKSLRDGDDADETVFSYIEARARLEAELMNADARVGM